MLWVGRSIVRSSIWENIYIRWWASTPAWMAQHRTVACVAQQNIVTSSLGCLHPHTHPILLILSYLILSSHFFHRPLSPHGDADGKAAVLPLLRFLNFACGELWLSSMVGVAEWLHALPPPTPVRSRASLVTGDGFCVGHFNRHAVPATAP
jgi:hypothetical protein